MQKFNFNEFLISSCLSSCYVIMYGKHCLILCASVVICHTLYKLLVLRRYF